MSREVLTYERLIAELFPRLTGGVQWGLDRTRRLLAAVGDPHRQFAVLHVGGTNGKGSVAAHLDSILRADGRRAGLYSSPHLCSFRERVRIDGEPIGTRALLDAAERLWPAILSEQASFFEATTAISFLAMADAGVECAVVEVGLGGRLDSTNVVEPEVVALTNVALDHVQMLGPHLSQVAAEKAGIIKPGVPVVTAESDPAVLDIFRAAADSAGARLERTVAHAASGPEERERGCALSDVKVSSHGTRFRIATAPWGDLDLRTPLIGAHQALNAGLAVHALAMLPAATVGGGRHAIVRPSREAVRRGVEQTRWPGRFQVTEAAGVRWIFDVAHNVAGVGSLIEGLRCVGPARPWVVVMGVLGDKDGHGMLAPLQRVADRVILTSAPTAPANRRWDPASVLAGVGAATPADNVSIGRDFAGALRTARSIVMPSGGTVIVTGSFHTVGDAMSELGLCEVAADASVADAVTQA